MIPDPRFCANESQIPGFEKNANPRFSKQIPILDPRLSKNPGNLRKPPKSSGSQILDFENQARIPILNPRFRK